ncbi:transglycosylase [Pandoraea iniqua]|uniref:hypothetical protein n=1 Tax=Pandoraea iniqua TaxID=2508288 RepID=UPI00123FF845|nr:hypothetical protein [Pandoraea iniqua]VVE59455.1 transglycosylase [Pandoraea iniqua]
MADYNVSAFPVSFKDATYDAADKAASAAHGIPEGWLNNIRLQGEKSNADQVSSAGARTPYQITRKTRDAIIDQTGVDPWLNPGAAAMGAAYLLKQSADRNGGNEILATAEYHGGTNRENWGPKTMAYAKRVTGASPNNPDATPSFAQPNGQNPYQLQAAPDVSNLGAGMPTSSSPSLSKVIEAYRSGQMPPDVAAEFERDVDAGRILLPRDVKIKAPTAPANNVEPVSSAAAAPTEPGQPAAVGQPMQIPAGAVTAFNNGQMPADVRSQMQADIKAGRAVLPQGASLQDPDAPPPSQGVVADVGRQLGLTARDAIQGAGHVAGVVYDPIAALINGAGSLIGHDPKIAPLGYQAEQAANALGLPKPVGSLERGVNAAAQGAAEAGTFAGAGRALAAGAGALPEIVGQIGKTFGADAGKQAVAMAAGQAAAQHAKDAGLSPAAQAAINLGTMVATMGGATAVEGAVSKAPTAIGEAAQRLYQSFKGEAPQTPAAARVEPTLPNPAADSTAPASNSSSPAPNTAPQLGASINPGAPIVTNPTVAALQQEKEALLPLAANSPAKGDASIREQIAALEGRSFDSIEARTKELQGQGLKFKDARAIAQRQLSDEMTSFQATMDRLHGQLANAQDGSRALQRIQEIDSQIAQLPNSTPASLSQIAQGTQRAFAESGRPQVPAALPDAATAAAAPALPTPAAAAVETAAAGGAPATAAATPTPEFMAASDLSTQARKAVGAQGAPFGMGKASARDVLATQGAPDAEALAAAERLGIADNLQPDHLTSNQAYRELAQAIKSTPGSLARADEMEGLSRVAERGMKIVEDAGGTRDLSGLSAQVKNDLANTQAQLEQKADALYKGIKADVPATMPVDAPNVLGFIEQRATDLGGSKNLSTIEKMVQSKLTAKEEPIVVGGAKVSPSQLGMEAQMQRPTYALLDDVRRNIGAGLKNEGPFKDADSGLLKALYARVSEDQRAALANSGVPNAVERFDAARAAVQMRKGIEDDMTSLFGKQLGDSIVGKLGSAVQSLSKGDETKFVNLMKAVPPSMRQQVTASGLNAAFGRATKNGELNFKNYADWMDGLKRNSGAFNAVMANLPAETRHQLLDLAKVSRSISNATREAITTGRIMAVRDQLNARAEGLMANVLEKAREGAVGATVAGAAHVGGPVGAGLAHAVMNALSRGKPEVMKAADELIVSPEFVQLAKNSITPTNQEVRALANSPQMRRFFSLTNSTLPNSAAAREQWVRSAISFLNHPTAKETNR